jgi:hypothetical protein
MCAWVVTLTFARYKNNCLAYVGPNLGSGVRIAENRVVGNTHYLLQQDRLMFRFLLGEYTVEV